MSKVLANGLAFLLLSCAYAHAAAPILSGSYVLVLRQWCQGNVTAHFNESNLIDSLDYDGGATLTLVGSADFDPDKGTVKVSGFSYNGSPFLLTATGNKNYTDGIPLEETPLSAAAGKYKNTAKIFKLGEETFHAIYSQLDKNGVAHAMTFMGFIPGLINCSAQGEATRQ